MVKPEEALPGRPAPMPVGSAHFVLGTPLNESPQEGEAEALFAMGCFWGAERLFWSLEGVVTTAVGYAGGFTENPSYEEVCTGRTGHTETVRVVYRPTQLSYRRLLQVFFEGHDPTQRNRQGNDIGTQYRSAIFVFGDEEFDIAREVARRFDECLTHAGFGPLVTEIVPVRQLGTSQPFFYAEDYHQQYLAKNPGGYCGLGGTGMACPVGLEL